MNNNEVEEILEKINFLESEIKEAETKRDDSIAFHQNKIEVAKRICDIDTREQREEIEQLKYSLECYYRDNPPKKGKSHKFSGGTFGYRKQNPRYYFNEEEITGDNPALVDFVRKFYDDFIKTKESVDWAKFKAALSVDDTAVYFTETGEILDGFRVQIIPDKFVVNINA